MTQKFTEQQVEALERAWQVLGEHFDRVALAVSADTEGPEGQSAESVRFYWSGGHSSAYGLFLMGAEEIRLANELNNREPA